MRHRVGSIVGGYARSLFVLVFASITFAPARADPETATAQLRARFQTEWHTLAGAPKAVDWRIAFRGKQFAGDRVVTLGGYRYFIDHGTVRCQVQEDKYMWCDGGAPTPPRWTASTTAARVKLATMVMLHRAVFRNALGIVIDDERHGHAIVETIVTTPDAEDRFSWRYRANVALTATTFAVGEPVLVEAYRETCIPINGCHSTHWNCRRLE